MSELPDPIPAATLVVMRPAAAAPELLMVERAGTMAFAAGALVFPGGRIDPGDHDAAAALLPSVPDGAARIAAIRETIEEAGIAVGLTPQPDEATSARLRDQLDDGVPFLALLRDAGLDVDAAALTPFARWCPNFRETRRFDALFFLAEAPVGAVATADEGESVRLFWASAEAILADVDAGRAHVIFPTRRNLERLALFASIDAARADAARHPVQQITPWVEEREGEPHVCIPKGIGYPVTSEPLTTARRR
ncbi:NUDIX hydrolase [Allosphingosinicella indica]|uniref:Nudix hydrolase domain-containing protein n=1 Tax=Allosphingosinicella indica TaxID=941907 RepID=A0A1X7FZM3_9SPHN|nr:NUDIX hydrolase [Allosphingosinicella indica]SMF61568.1 hypothetical protein SAMN06295910_0560 [Allosphingosinicella indica]